MHSLKMVFFFFLGGGFKDILFSPRQAAYVSNAILNNIYIIIRKCIYGNVILNIYIYIYRPKSSGLEKRNSKTKTCVSQFCVSRLILQGCIHTYSHQTDSRQQPGREE